MYQSNSENIIKEYLNNPCTPNKSIIKAKERVYLINMLSTSIKIKKLVHKLQFHNIHNMHFIQIKKQRYGNIEIKQSKINQSWKLNIPTNRNKDKENKKMYLDSI